MTKYLTLSIGVLAAGLAASASAVTISFQYDGGIAPLLSQQSVTATAFYTNPPAQNASALSYRYSPSASFADGVGSLSLAGGTIDFMFVGTSDAFGGVTGGIVQFSDGTGDYAGFGGTGSLSHAVIDGNVVAGNFDAQINPVPEPASMAALGVGAAGLIRRRARKAGR